MYFHLVSEDQRFHREKIILKAYNRCGEVGNSDGKHRFWHNNRDEN